MGGPLLDHQVKVGSEGRSRRARKQKIPHGRVAVIRLAGKIIPGDEAVYE
jgi:hypothetical protein